MKSGGFHEIRRISPWNLADFVKSVKSGGFHPWNPADFTHEIWQISPVKSSGFHLWNLWNPVDFMKSMKSGGFHEIWQISWNPWNPADFTCEIWQISPRYQPVKSTQNYKSKCFSKNSSVWWMQGGAMTKDFMKFTLKSGGFHPWNLADFTQISPVKSTQNYESKCFSKNSSVWWMQGGAMTKDFMKFTLKSGGFHLWNPVDFTPDFTCEIYPKLKKQVFQQKLFSLMNAGWGLWPRISWNSPWNLVDFTCEIQWNFHPDFTCEIYPKL